MKKSRVVIITVVVTVVIIVIAGLVIKGATKKPEKGEKVRIEQPQKGELVETVSAPGEIQPKIQVDISAKVSARITALPYKEGDVVTCGEPEAEPPVPASVLVKLDSKGLESQLRSAEASYAAQAAQVEVEKAKIEGQKATLRGLAETLKQAERDLKRKKGLFESQDISQAAFDEVQCKVDEQKAQYAAAEHTLEAARLSLVVLQHNLEVAEARIAEAQEALSYTTITSPINGVVTRLNAEVGELVMTGTMNNPGTVIAIVADLSQMVVVAEVDEVDIGKLSLGQQATVKVQAFADKQFKAVVDTIALMHNVSMTGTKYYKTEILLENNEQVQLNSGLTADVDIQTKRHTDILKVPSQAVLGRAVDELPLEIREDCPQVDTNKTYATVVYRFVDGKAVVTPVEIGPSDMTHTIILSGISEGDKVVVGPYKVLEKLKHDKKLRDEREEDSGKDEDSESSPEKADEDKSEDDKEN